MTRICLIPVLVLVIVQLGSTHAAQRPNVLFLVADDLNTRLGCYGDPLARTPNLDKLAARGVKFERAYCQYPLCSPSRTSFLTGLRPDHSGVVNNSTHFRTVKPDVVTLPQAFRQAGYFVARVGKLFHYAVPAQIGTDGFDDVPSWEKVVNPKGRDVADEERIFTLRPDAEGAARFAGTLSWLAADGADGEQTDGMSANAAVKLLEGHRDRPFFLAVGFFRPHLPLVAPKKHFAMHPLERIELPVIPADLKKRFPSPALPIRKEHEAMTDRQRREAIQAYHAATSFMDAQAGVVLDALERLKLVDKTIVVFLSDHGFHLGDKHLWQKLTLFEESARVPLIVAAPGAKGNGRPCGRTVELVDLYPTLADLCGLKAPGKLDGQSLRPLLHDPGAEWNKPAFTQVLRGAPVGTFDNAKKTSAGFMGRSVRTEQFRYTEWDGGRKGVELYDHHTDPQELRNLADDPRFKKKVEEMALALHRSTRSGEK
ncbi:MAG: sulfatase [Verrucomicrobiota bacterium]